MLDHCITHRIFWPVIFGCSSISSPLMTSFCFFLDPLSLSLSHLPLHCFSFFLLVLSFIHGYSITYNLLLISLAMVLGMFWYLYTCMYTKYYAIYNIIYVHTLKLWLIFYSVHLCQSFPAFHLNDWSLVFCPRPISQIVILVLNSLELWVCESCL